MLIVVNDVCSEILRVIDSLQLTARKKVATPVDWKVTLLLIMIIHVVQ